MLSRQYVPLFFSAFLLYGSEGYLNNHELLFLNQCFRKKFFIMSKYKLKMCADFTLKLPYGTNLGFLCSKSNRCIKVSGINYNSFSPGRAICWRKKQHLPGYMNGFLDEHLCTSEFPLHNTSFRCLSQYVDDHFWGQRRR